jgi:hypothetical protein
VQALESFGSARASRVGGEFKGLSVCAHAATDIAEAWLSSVTGVASVSVTESPDAVHALLSREGEAVVQRLMREKVAEAELRLRLRQLMRSPELSPEQFKSGCFHLLQHEQMLRKYVEGSIVRLSDRNVILPGQQVINVAWDFEM